MVVWFVWFDPQYLMYTSVPWIQDFRKSLRTRTITLFRTCLYNTDLMPWGIILGDNEIAESITDVLV